MNSQVCEQAHSSLETISTQVKFMSQDHFLQYVRYFLYRHNMGKIRTLEETRRHDRLPWWNVTQWSTATIIGVFLFYLWLVHMLNTLTWTCKTTAETGRHVRLTDHQGASEAGALLVHRRRPPLERYLRLRNYLFSSLFPKLDANASHAKKAWMPPCPTHHSSKKSNMAADTRCPPTRPATLL